MLNSNPVVVLSFNYWKTNFASDPGVVNQTLLINTQPFTIVGVAPPAFHSIVAGALEDVFVPLGGERHHHAALAGPGRPPVALDYPGRQGSSPE